MAFSIQNLDRSHDLKGFNCGSAALNAWLQNTAGQHQKKGISRTYVLVADESLGIVIGYYSLAIRGMTPIESLPQPMKKSLPLSAPAVTIARLAVSLKQQKQGHGERLLLDAMTRVKSAANLIGGSFLFVDAKDVVLAEFYARYGFIALPDDPLTLCMRISDIPE